MFLIVGIDLLCFALTYNEYETEITIWESSLKTATPTTIMMTDMITSAHFGGMPNEAKT